MGESVTKRYQIKRNLVTTIHTFTVLFNQVHHIRIVFRPSLVIPSGLFEHTHT